MITRAREIRDLSGMSRKEFADYFDIPQKSIENWEQGVRECPKYVLDLMEYKLRKERVIK